MKDDIVCKHCEFDIYVVGYHSSRPYCIQCNLFLEDFEVMVIA